MKRKNKRQFNWYSLNQRFSIRKYHFGAASVLLGTSLVFGNPTSVSADVVDVQPAPTGVDKAKLDNNPAAPTSADLNKVFTSADVSKNGGAPEGSDTVTGKTVVDYKYETTTGVEIEAPALDQVQGTNTVSTPYDNGVADTNNATDGKDYRESTVSAPLTFDKEAGKKAEIKAQDGKTYEHVETVESGTASTEYDKTAFNDVSVSVTPENLHTATGEIKYDQITGGKVWIVEETADGKFGNFVVADAATSDAQVVEAFKSGVSKALSQAEVTAAGGIKNGDHIIVLDKDVFELEHAVNEKFENRKFARNTQTMDYYGVVADMSNQQMSKTQFIDYVVSEVERARTGASEFTNVAKLEFDPTEFNTDNDNDGFIGFNKIYIPIADVREYLVKQLPDFTDIGAYIKANGETGLVNVVESMEGTLNATVTDAITAAKTYISDLKTKYANGRVLQPASEDYEIEFSDTFNTGAYEGNTSVGKVQESLFTPIRAYKVVESDKVVTYKYEEVKKGSVLVKYVEAGTTNELVPEVPAVTNRPLKDGPYDASGFKQDTVQDKEGKIWELVGLEANSKPEKGDLVADQTLEVVYGYKLKTEETAEGALVNSKVGTVLVDFVDEAGQAIPGIDQVTLKDKVTVETSQKFVTKSGTVVISERTEVTPVQDAYDSKPLATPTITAKDGKVYEFVKLLSGTEAGDVQEGTHNVVYQYRLKTEESQAGDAVASKKGSVEVQYVNEAGETIKAPEADTTDATVETTTTLVTKSGTVEISRRDQVTPVVVNYDTTDKKENEITAADGTIYEFSKVRSGAETGQVVEGKTVVVYEYRVKPIFVIPNLPVETVDIPEIEINAEEKDGDLKDSKVGKVTVEHILEDGTLITSEVDTADTVVERTQTYVTKTKDGLVLNSRDEVTPVEVNYDTTDLKAEYKEFNGKKYYFLKVADNSAAETGKVAAGETKVVYVYRLVEGGTPDLPVLTIDIPELNIGVPNLPGELPPTTPEKPELNIGVPNLPGELPPTNPEKPELNIGVPNLPGELPPTTPEKPELNIGVPNLPGELPPTVPDKPELELPTPESDIPNDFPTVDIPEGRINIPTPPVGETPNKPELPATETPESPTNVTSGEPTASTYSRVARNTEALPNTGDSENAFAAVTGVATVLAAFGLVGKRRRKED